MSGFARSRGEPGRQRVDVGKVIMKITPEIIKSKKNFAKIIALTAYDYTFAKLLDTGGVDIILIGDTVGMVCHGDKNTRLVTMDQMVYHTEGVARGVETALVVGDMPINSYSVPEEAVMNARRLVAAGAQAVKIEAVPGTMPAVQAIIQAGIPVMGHVGLTPQTAEAFKVQGKSHADAERIKNDARIFDESGVFSLVLECIPVQLAREITESVAAPTIGIGAGPHCDGQILVSYDLLGMFQDFRPKFVRTFFDGSAHILQALAAFRKAVSDGDFPADKESFTSGKP
jgi:3-methyl-2-oxobutanoate hydroxymethyltransferase